MDAQPSPRTKRAGREVLMNNSMTPLIAALEAGRRECSRLIKKYPAAPASATWTFVRDLLTEMRRAANAEQAAFEDWLELYSPSGDHESIRKQWEQSTDFRDLIAMPNEARREGGV